jgi:hypothetical protein
MNRIKVFAWLLTGLLICSLGLSEGAFADTSGADQAAAAADAGLAADAAGATPTSGLTVADAILRAELHSLDLRLSDLNIKSSGLNLDTAQEDFDNWFSGSGDYDRVFVALVESNIDYQKAKLNYDTALDQLHLDTARKYTNILLAQAKMAAADKSLEIAAYKKCEAQARYSLGLISQAELNDALLSYESSHNAAEQARQALEDSYAQFNELIGLDSEERPQLAYEQSYQPLVIGNLEEEIVQKMNADPGLWSASQEVSKAELRIDYLDEDSVDDYQALQYTLAKSKINYQQTQNQKRLNITQLYDNVRELERQIALHQHNLATAENNLDMVKFKQSLGMVNQGEVLAAEKNLLENRQNLNSLLYQHLLAKMAFETPWAA